MGSNEQWSTTHLAYLVRAKGQQAERLALKYLKAQGLKLLTQNFSGAGGEVDLIMREMNTLVFIEVRSKSSTKYGTPEDSISLAKQRRICQCAQLYCQSIGIDDQQPCRFDVIAIVNDQINWIKGAFESVS